MHVLGEQAADIEVHDADADVAVVSNAASLGSGMAGTWAGVAAVGFFGGPVGWGVAAGIVVGAGTGYAAYYFLNTGTGKKVVHAVTDTVSSVSEGIGEAAKKVRGWLGF